MKNKPHITNVEWGLVIAALALVDLVQFGLDLLFQAGVIVNRVIDVFVGLSFGFYLYIRGQTDKSQYIALVVTFFAEEIPEVDALPFWFADGVYAMVKAKAIEKADKLAANVSSGQKTS